MSDPKLDRIVKTLRPLPFPTRFAVEVCADCNLACSMCHHPNMARPKGRMPLRLWKKCADEIAATAPTTQCWFSFCGEPLLEPELLLDMLAYGKSVGLQSLNINTNGMLLSPELADRIGNSGADLIVFGIDAFSSETYSRIRVNGDRDTLYQNIEDLLAKRHAQGTDIEVQVQFIEMKENEHELDQFKSHWMERGATLKIRNMLSWGGKFESALCVPFEERIPCPWALTMMHVFWDGRVPRCPGDTEGEEGVGNAWDAVSRRSLEGAGRLPREALVVQIRRASRSLPELHGLDDRLGATNPAGGDVRRVGAMRVLHLCGAGNCEAVRLAVAINQRESRWDKIVLLDDDIGRHGEKMLGVEIVGAFSQLGDADPTSDEIVNLVARTTLGRWTVQRKLESYGLPFASLISPDVDVSGVELADDVIVYKERRRRPDVHCRIRRGDLHGRDARKREAEWASAASWPRTLPSTPA